MRPILELRYIVVPILMGWLFSFMFFLSLFFYVLGTGDLWAVLAWATGLSLVIGGILGVVLADIVGAMARGEYVPGANSYRFAKDAPQEITVRAETSDGMQVDFFRGLTPEQWYRCALRVAAHIQSGNRSFTFAVVGQTERPILVPVMLAAEYIVSVGKGEYELTERGIDWWLSLAALPYPWDHAPQKLRNLPIEPIYT